ncbi:MAG: hypothetical protein K2P88_14710 [Chitinophagaceae bacterium]|uniref:hypothetical protein n=1 Tax=unclassified Paraflavitalea TaxID=2798305 RepID=UPI003D357922|nr:hypothetical protein [Chitinophagaceae bacterium]
MKQKISTIAIAILSFFVMASCEKEETNAVSDCGKPASAAPAGLVGNWASGYASMTQLVDVYNGKYVGNAWVSGKFFKITNNGKGAEFYYSAQSQYAQTATKATGSIFFEAGSTATEGSFIFSPCNAHYKGWGSIVVDRDATATELENNLTARYYYRLDGQWLRIQPNAPVNDYSSSFKLVN